MSGRCTPASILTMVDLPAPFSPTSAWIEPDSTRSEPDAHGRTAPKDFVTSRTSSAGAVVGACAHATSDPMIEMFQCVIGT